jgi:hypothetical protein
MTAASPLHDLEVLRAAGAAQQDAVGWHYIETLAERTQAQSGLAHQLLLTKLQAALEDFEVRTLAASASHAGPETSPVTLSPMALLLQEMGTTSHTQGAGKAVRFAEKPRIQQLKKQLRQISVQQQVTQAIAHAPQNAGPINSQMLVLRSLGLMHEASPDYLDRFMGYVNTLLYLDEAGAAQVAPRRSTGATVTKK